MMNSVFHLFKKNFFFFAFVSRIYFSGYRVPRLTITLFLLHFKDAVPFSSGFHYFWEGFYFSLITLLEVSFSSGRIKKSLSFWLFDVLSVVFLQVIASLNLWFDIFHQLWKFFGYCFFTFCLCLFCPSFSGPLIICVIMDPVQFLLICLIVQVHKFFSCF